MSSKIESYTRTKCLNCGEPFDISPNNIQKEKFQSKEKQSMWITHYDCPKCGRIHYCQIDNEQTNALLIEAGSLLRKLTILKRNGQNVSKKIRSTYERNALQLKKIRYNLMSEYHGKELINPEGELVKVEFVHE